MQVLSPQEMRRADRIAIEEMGIPGIDLMERAGSEVGRVIRGYAGIAGRRAVVLCGKGNNGGDGLVVARWLASRGVDVEVLLFCRGEELSGEAAINLGRARHRRIPLHELPDEERDGPFAERVARADVVVDALLGTGFSGVPCGRVVDAIRMTRAASGMIFAVDAPSGVDCATGLVEGDAVQADVTVTLCRVKQGLLLYPGRSYAGEIVVAPIGIPEEALREVGGKTLYFERQDAASLVSPRERDAHKGRFGRIAIAGGSPCLTGAPYLAGMAALRAGGGLVTLAIPLSLHPLYAGKVVELMTTPLPDQGGAHCRDGARAFLDDAGRFDVLALGPGLGRGDGQRAFVRELLERWEGPMVIDADGLNALAGEEALLRRSPGTCVLTPHLGEMETLTGVDRRKIGEDRIAFVREWAERLGAVLLLKGNPTLVAGRGGVVSINSTGNPGMATAGSGDVLTGAVAALLGAGMPAEEAARLAVWLHGRAGDLGAARKGEAGLIAGDLIDELPSAMAPLESRDGLR